MQDESEEQPSDSQESKGNDSQRALRSLRCKVLEHLQYNLQCKAKCMRTTLSGPYSSSTTTTTSQVNEEVGPLCSFQKCALARVWINHCLSLALGPGTLMNRVMFHWANNWMKTLKRGTEGPPGLKKSKCSFSVTKHLKTFYVACPNKYDSSHAVFQHCSRTVLNYRNLFCDIRDP
ncbi:hypothetical protein J4Q44_G00180460 [Coregonus suidteri]|uniref:Uncharacterized protein n=1 Tax=Coregonus suidteri TaxID=861788 RepID=A0AAN8R460_9TELE